MTKLLFFDDTQLMEKWNLQRRLGQPSPVAEATVQVPGIDLAFSYPTVFPNPETGGWRMLYQALTGRRARKRPSHFIPAAADSRDGIHWEIPDLQASVPVAEQVLPNQVGPASLDRFGEWGPCYYDHRAQDPRHRIKGFVCKGHGPGTGKKDSWIVTSPNGLTWRDLSGALWHPYGSDPAVCAFWNRYRHSYVLAIRPKNGDRRIALMETPDWKEFSKVELALSPDGLDPDLAELYGMPTFPYGNLFIGLLWVYRTSPRSTQHGKFLGGRIDCQLAYSYDGWHFQRGLRDSFLGNAAPGRIGAGCLLPCSLIVTEKEIRLYSCATAKEHAIFEDDSPQKSAILMHRLRLDGFVYLDAPSGTGWLKTRAMLVQGNRLSFNVQVPDGQLRVGVKDADGNPIPGLALEDCRPCSADSTEWVPRWKGAAHFGRLQGKAVQLELQISGGRLYAISGDFRMLAAKEGMRYMKFGTPPDPSHWGP